MLINKIIQNQRQHIFYEMSAVKLLSNLLECLLTIGDKFRNITFKV